MTNKSIKLWSDEKEYLRNVLAKARDRFEPNDEQRKPYNALLERLEQSKMSTTKDGAFCYVDLAGGSYEICRNVLSKSEDTLAQKILQKLTNAPNKLLR